MTFAEIFQKYKDGTATEKERKIVEDELRKTELINEYYEEKWQLLQFQEADADTEQEVKAIKKKIDKHLWKKIVMAICLIAIVGVVACFGSREICNRVSYNPNETVGETSEETDAFRVNVDTFLELHCPEQRTVRAEAEALGAGKYNITIKTTPVFSKSKTFSTVLDKGETITTEKFYDEILTRSVFYEAGPSFVYDSEGNLMEDRQEGYYRLAIQEELGKLPDTALVSAYISFEEDMTLTELLEFMGEVPEEVIRPKVWVAVRTTDEVQYEVMGCYLSMDQNQNEWETHFKSLLKHMADQDEFYAAFCSTFMPSVAGYRDALEYVEEHGVNVFGLYLVGSPDVLSEVEQMEEVASFEIGDMTLSKYDR